MGNCRHNHTVTSPVPASALLMLSSVGCPAGGWFPDRLRVTHLAWGSVLAIAAARGQ